MSAPQYGRPSRRPRPQQQQHQQSQRQTSSPRPPEPLAQAHDRGPGNAVPQRDDTPRPRDGRGRPPPLR